MSIKITKSQLKKYKGDLIGRMRQGQGMQTWEDGSKYDGSWEDNIPNGHGTYCDLYGDIYAGNFLQGRANGFGTLTKKEGGIYSGNWVLDSPKGKGLKYIQGGNVYIGDFDQGRKSGYGELTYINGDKYKGFFKNGQFHGFGVFLWKTGKTYSGNWENGFSPTRTTESTQAFSNTTNDTASALLPYPMALKNKGSGKKAGIKTSPTSYTRTRYCITSNNSYINVIFQRRLSVFQRHSKTI
jgi:hypothetical protein